MDLAEYVRNIHSRYHGFTPKAMDEINALVKSRNERDGQETQWEPIKPVEDQKKNMWLTIWLKHSGYLRKITTPEEIERVKKFVRGRPDLSGLTIVVDEAEWVIPHNSISHLSVSAVRVNNGH